MSKIKGRVAACYDQFKVPGLAMVHLTISPNGLVAVSIVTGSFSGTPTGRCVEQTVLAAHVPESTTAATIDCPFMLR